MGLVRGPQLYRCGIAWIALANPFLYLKGSSFVWDDLSPWARQYRLPELVGDADQDAAMLTAASSVAQAARIRAPLLRAYGGKDVRVPLEHGERLRVALEKAGNPPDWVVYPKEGHGWRSVADRVDWAQRMEAFLARHLGARSPRNRGRRNRRASFIDGGAAPKQAPLPETPAHSNGLTEVAVLREGLQAMRVSTGGRAPVEADVGRKEMFAKDGSGCAQKRLRSRRS